MSSFSIGGSGGASAKAKTIAEGSKVRIAAMSFTPSRYNQVIQKGSNAGKEMPKYQLRVDLQPIPEGETATQYLGGVYPKDYADLGKGFTLTENGSARAFIGSLVNAGASIPSEVEGFVGIEFVATHHKGGLGKLAFDHIHAKEVLKANTATATVTASAAPVSAPASGAFGALAKADQETIVEALKDGDVTVADLVGAGIAKDTAHANEILATVPGAKKVLKKAA